MLARRDGARALDVRPPEAEGWPSSRYFGRTTTDRLTTWHRPRSCQGTGERADTRRPLGNGSGRLPSACAIVFPYHPEESRNQSGPCRSHRGRPAIQGSREGTDSSCLLVGAPALRQPGSALTTELLFRRVRGATRGPRQGETARTLRRTSDPAGIVLASGTLM